MTYSRLYFTHCSRKKCYFINYIISYLIINSDDHVTIYIYIIYIVYIIYVQLTFSTRGSIKDRKKQTVGAMAIKHQTAKNSQRRLK